MLNLDPILPILHGLDHETVTVTLVLTLRNGGVIKYEVPHSSESRRGDAPRAQDAAAPAVAETTVPIVRDRTIVARLAPIRRDETLIACVERIRREQPGIMLKTNEWRDVTGISERELRRAIDHQVIPRQDRGEGRDHAAVMVCVDDMLRYVTTVAAVECGDMERPTWWTDVRGRRAAA